MRAVLPSGELGVVDACSGALSLTALTAISLLAGYVRLTFLGDFTRARVLALFALTLIALPPIVTHTIVGMRGVVVSFEEAKMLEEKASVKSLPLKTDPEMVFVLLTIFGRSVPVFFMNNQIAIEVAG